MKKIKVKRTISVFEDIDWKELEKRFLEKYPNGKICRHGEMADCDVAVIFNEKSKVYNYRGTYLQVALKLGLTEERFEEIEEEIIDFFRLGA